MPQTIREVMSANPVTLSRNSSVVEAARAMREKDIGDVVVMDNGNLYGIATDRDLVVARSRRGKGSPKNEPRRGLQSRADDSLARRQGHGSGRADAQQGHPASARRRKQQACRDRFSWRPGDLRRTASPSLRT